MLCFHGNGFVKGTIWQFFLHTYICCKFNIFRFIFAYYQLMRYNFIISHRHD